MIHYFNLHDAPFEKIANGKKTIELRLFDKKRQLIKLGDTIIFSNHAGSEIKVIVKALHRFVSFKELYENLDLLKCGYSNNCISEASYKDMEEYYSVTAIERYGVIGIEFEVKC